MPATRDIQAPIVHRGDTRGDTQVLSSQPSHTAQSSSYTANPRNTLADGRSAYDERTKRFKRPRNAFIFFRSHYNDTRDAHSKIDQGAVSRRAGELWAMMSEEHRAPFVKMAQDEVQWYKANHPDVVFTRRKKGSETKRERRGRPDRERIEFLMTQPRASSSSTLRFTNHNPALEVVDSFQWPLAPSSDAQASPPLPFDEMEGFQDSWEALTDEAIYEPSNDIPQPYCGSSLFENLQHAPYEAIDESALSLLFGFQDQEIQPQTHFPYISESQSQTRYYSRPAFEQ